MSEQLETLFKLQDRDLQLLEKQREIDRFEAELAERRKAMGAVTSRVEALAATRKELVNQRALAERRVSEQQDQLRQRGARLQRVRNDRELRAGTEEVNTLHEEITKAEELQIELMAKIEALETEIAEGKTEFSSLEDADHRHIAEVSDRIEALRKELLEERAGRDGIAADLEPMVRKRYDLILQRRAGLAVVPVREGCCGGCHIHIPPQTLIEIMKTRAVRVCPSCQRILYVTAPGNEPKEAETA